MRLARLCVLSIASIGLTACGSEVAGLAVEDTGVPPGSSTDSTVNADAAAPDSGLNPIDAAHPDAAPDDAGEADAAPRDGGFKDAGQADAGESDAGFPDAGILPGPVQITLGEWHTCALMPVGVLRCAGSNARGELGLAHTTQRNEFTETVLTDVLQVEAGNRHTCAVLDNTGAACWGQNEMGQLGAGSVATSTCAIGGGGEEDCSLDPLAVVDENESPLLGARKLASGGFFTCALLMDKTVRCWGTNLGGVLGIGTLDASPRRTARAVALGQVSDLAAGEIHTCAVAEGEVYCWGRNNDGQLGQGMSVSNHPSPARVDGIADVEAVVAGSEHTCALQDDGVDRTVWCWGSNEHGQLGAGTTALWSGDPIQVLSSTTSNAPLVGVRALASSRQGNCVVLVDDTVRCWGVNDHGQLGLGHEDGDAHPIPRAPNNLTQVLRLSMGVGRAVFAVRIDGSALAWGWNTVGQAGLGTAVAATQPTPVPSLIP